MSWKVLGWAAEQNVKRAADKLVLFGLADRHNTESDVAYPSIAWLVEFSGLDRKTVIAALDRLEAAGLISDSGERRGKTKQVKAYRLSYNGPEKGIPKTELFNGTVIPGEQSQKGDTEPSREPREKVQATPSPSPARVSAAAAFELFWNTYPRKVGKHAAQTAWLKAAKRDGAARIQSGAERYAAHPPDDPQFIPHPTTWLNGGRYDDPIEETHNARRNGPVCGNGQARQHGGGQPTPRVSAALRLVAEERALAHAH